MRRFRKSVYDVAGIVVTNAGYRISLPESECRKYQGFIHPSDTLKIVEIKVSS